ncbi:glycosyltransferase family 39 protein [Horticoccus luteus]|uniref:Glycosyltransferase family 39 protein n=1 Tax=Horticoccus luteus TaxID=2862869 RepID=A0A8F9XFW6_9BACT|nr:glycosyltransferase family 39 protein [Horticoccus luteus]QYM77560.1 glycosyltransferase family 39 protein [Horticoccus luteus]
MRKKNGTVTPATTQKMDALRPPDSPACPPRLWPRSLVALVLLVALAAYGAFMFPRLGAVAGGSDSSGYLNNARLLAQRRVTVPARPVAGAEPLSVGAREPLGFHPSTDDTALTPTYPTGFPLLILAATTFTTWTAAPNVVAGAHLLAGLLLTYLLARACGLRRPWAALAFLLLASSPLFPFIGLQAMSDVPALVWIAAAVLAALHARRHAAWAVAAGFAFGLAVLIRPTNALALLPLALALGGSWRRWLGFGLGGAPAAAFFAAYNHAAYGSMLATGYGNPGTDFSRHFFIGTLGHYVVWLPVLLTPVVLAGLALPFMRSLAPIPVRRVLLAWVAVFLGFFACYRFTSETWWYLRFLLPAFPALIIGALLVLQAITPRARSLLWPASVWALAACAIIAIGAGGMRSLRALKSGRDESSYVEVSRWAQSHLPADAVIVCMQNSGALFYYTDFALLRWDWVKPDDFRHIAAANAAAPHPIYALLQDFEVPTAFHHHLPGRWEVVDQVRNVTIWKLRPSS